MFGLNASDDIRISSVLARLSFYSGWTKVKLLVMAYRRNEWVTGTYDGASGSPQLVAGNSLTGWNATASWLHGTIPAVVDLPALGPVYRNVITAAKCSTPPGRIGVSSFIGGLNVRSADTKNFLGRTRPP